MRSFERRRESAMVWQAGMICDDSAGEQLHLLTHTNALNPLARFTMV
jgi:hypothetical protein